MLVKRVTSESTSYDVKVKDLANQWSSNKPLDGQIDYKKALETVGGFRIHFEGLEKEGQSILLARKALGIVSVQDHNSDVKIVLEEIRDFEQVWLQLGLIWSDIHSLRELHWSELTVATLNSVLRNVEMRINGLPTFIKQYSGCLYLETCVKELKAGNKLLVDLKSDFLRERHWFGLISALNLTVKYQQLGRLTLGQLWDSCIVKSEVKIKEILDTARGEVILEDFLGLVRETWNNYCLLFVTYQGKCHLIKGWEELLSTCKDHLASISSMSSSVYYGIFEDEASHLEKRLDNVFLIFDSWIEVQRQWVYLEGIFSGNMELNALLPVESSRFNGVNLEFVQLMAKVQRITKVLEIAAIPDIKATLARFSSVFGVLQKALLEYLELQRSQFSRFFFVGDEDLLDIIGNSKDLNQIQKHLKKMFPGIHSLLTADDQTTILGVVSLEGETLKLLEPVETKEIQVSEWLHQLDLCVKQSLAESIPGALDSFTVIGSTSSELRQWIESHSCQALLLASQIQWTDRIENALSTEGISSRFKNVKSEVERLLLNLSDIILADLPALLRKKVESLITEVLHQKGVTETMETQGICDVSDFGWLICQRFYYVAGEDCAVKRVKVVSANAENTYGFEYLGVPDRLVQTPLTRRCFSTLMQALNYKMGGSPFGPAGTGKTETVKALGMTLGHPVMIFCCDERFEVHSLERILTGVCRVGAWACFDEFNRLEERILSSVSQQLLIIQSGLKESKEVSLAKKKLRVSPDTGNLCRCNCWPLR